MGQYRLHIDGYTITHREYEIVLSPKLGISTAEFTTSWNELTEERTTHNIDQARVEKEKGAQYDLTLLTIILITIGGGEAANVISAYIMKVLEEHGKADKH